MTPSELAADLRTRINPAYADQLGTESYERRLCAEAIDALIAELASIKGQEPCPYCWLTQPGVPAPKADKQASAQAKPLTEAAYRSEINGVSQMHPLAAKLPNGEIASNVYQAYDIGYEQGVKFRAGKHRAWIGPNGAFTQDKKRVEKWERKGFPFITLLSDARYDL